MFLIELLFYTMDQKNRMYSRFTNNLLPLLGRHEKSLVPSKEGFISSNLASTVKFSSSSLKNNKEEERTTETANLVSRLFLSETNLMAYPFLLYKYTGVTNSLEMHCLTTWIFEVHICHHSIGMCFYNKILQRQLTVPK